MRKYWCLGVVKFKQSHVSVIFYVFFHINVYNSKANWDIFTKTDTHMYGLTLRTRKKNCGTEPLGGAIIEQNMKFPLTSIQFCEIKCYFHSKPTFSNSSHTVCPIFTKIESYHPQTVPTKSYGFRVNWRNRFRIAQQQIWGMMLKALFRLYVCNALTYWHQTLHVSLSLHSDHITSVLKLHHLLVESDNPLQIIFNYCFYDFSAILPKILFKCL